MDQTQPSREVQPRFRLKVDGEQLDDLLLQATNGVFTQHPGYWTNSRWTLQIQVYQESQRLIHFYRP